MHPILAKALNRIGVKSVNDLTSDEQDVFKQWQVALSAGPLTSDEVVESMKLLLSDTLDSIETTGNNKNDLNLLIATVKVVRHFLRIVGNPQKETISHIQQEVDKLY